MSKIQDYTSKIWDDVYSDYEQGENVGNIYPNEPLVRIVSTQRKNFSLEKYYEDKGTEFSDKNHFNGSALEIGFGTVANLQMVREKGYQPVYGIEVSHEAVKRGISKLNKSGYKDITLSHWKPTQLDFEDNTFSLVYGLQCIYYNIELEEVIKEVKRVLKPGGLFAFSFFSNKSGYLKYIDIVDGDLVKWSDDHPNSRLRGAYFRQAKDKSSLKTFFKDFKEVKVFTEESDFSPMFHSWWYIQGIK